VALTGSFVAGPRRQHTNVSFFELKRLSEAATKLDTRGSTYDGKHLMGGAVKVVIAKYAIHPNALPAVFRQQSLTSLGQITASLERTGIDNERKARIVWNRAVVCKSVANWVNHERGGAFI
jgi:hypothetical protein